MTLEKLKAIETDTWPVPLFPTVTPQFNRVRQMHWCPKCQGEKSIGLLVCWPCNARLKRVHDGGHGPTMERTYEALDLYLFDHNESQARKWLQTRSSYVKRRAARCRT